MYSTEEKMEKIDKVQDTTSSDFYPRKSVPCRIKQPLEQPLSVDRLESKLAKVRQILASGQQLINRLQSNQQLKKHVEETLEELSVVKARTLKEQNNLKLSFQKNYSSLERQLNSYKKIWKQMKENTNNQIEEQVTSFKENIKKDQQWLKKTLKNTNSDLKAKSDAFAQELKDAKKARIQSTGSLMSMIEQVRVKFEAFTEGQRKKRTEYDGIVLGLLDRTVDQGEKILRRIG